MTIKMVTSNGLYESGGAEELGSGEMSVQSKGISYGEMGKISVQILSNIFLKILTEGATTTEYNDREGAGCL